MPQQATATPATGDQRIPMSYEEYLDFAADIHAEWVDGETIVFMPPNIRHQEIVGFLLSIINLFARLFDLGKVLTAPCAMRMHPDDPRSPSRQPDLFFVAKQHEDRLTEARLLGPADLIVEVVSKESATRDRAEKFAEYAAGGVREYWIIDPRPEQQRVDCYTLAPTGSYIPMVPDAAGQIHSLVLPGLWLQPGWFWQEPLPDPLRTLARLSPEVAQALQRSLAAPATEGM